MVEKIFEFEIERRATIRVTLDDSDLGPEDTIEEWAEETALDRFHGIRAWEETTIEDDDTEIDSMRLVEPDSEGDG